MTVRRIPGTSLNPDLPGIETSTNVSRDESLLQNNPDDHTEDRIERHSSNNSVSDAENQSNSYSSIRSEIAGALGVSESDPSVNEAYTGILLNQAATQEDTKAAQNQAMLDAAMKNGVRNEEKVKIGDQDGTLFTEYVPSASGDLSDTVTRTGEEITTQGWFGDSTERFTKYFSASGKALGWIQSVIENGKETVTGVGEYVPGAIDVKPGDSRDASDPGSSQAGKVPKTWDPKSDGSYGKAGGDVISNEQSEGSLSDAPLVQAEGTWVQTYHTDDNGKTWSSQLNFAPKGDTTQVEVTHAPDDSFRATNDIAQSDPSEWNAYPGASGGSTQGSGGAGGSTGTSGSSGSSGTQGSQGTQGSSSTETTNKTEDLSDEEEAQEEEEVERGDDDAGSGFTNDFGDDGIPSILGNSLFHLAGGVGIGGGDSMSTGDGDPSNESAPGVNVGSSSTGSTDNKDNTGPTKPTLGPYMGDNDTVVNPRANSMLESFEAETDINDYTPPNETSDKGIIE